MKEFCYNCMLEQDIIKKEEEHEFQVRGVLIKAKINVLFCSKCNEEIYNKTNEINNDTIIYDKYKEHEKLLTSQEIKNIRGKYNLSQKDFARLLKLGDKSITRYENGAIQEKSIDQLIRLVDNFDNFLLLYGTSAIYNDQKMSIYVNKLVKSDLDKCNISFNNNEIINNTIDNEWNISSPGFNSNNVLAGGF